MATMVTATCSECYQEQEIELSPRRNEIVCEFCRHSVPMFEKRELDDIRRQLAGERKKMYIALAVFAGAIFLFALYWLGSTGDYQAQYVDSDGNEQRVDFLERDDASITIETADGDEQKIRYSGLTTQIEQLQKDDPLLTDDQAAKRAGESHYRVVAPEPNAGVQILLYLSVLGGLAAIAFASIASQDRLICEF